MSQISQCTPIPGSATVIVGLERQIFVFPFPRRSSIFSAYRSQSCRDRPITDSPVHERLDAPEQEIQDFRDTPEPQEVSHGTTHAHPNTEKKKIFHISATDLQGTYVSMLSAIFLGCVLAFFIFKRLHEIYFKILWPHCLSTKIKGESLICKEKIILMLYIFFM